MLRKTRMLSKFWMLRVYKGYVHTCGSAPSSRESSISYLIGTTILSFADHERRGGIYQKGLPARSGKEVTI